METNYKAIADPEYYDKIYKDNPIYICDYQESPYYDIWMQTLSYIPDGSTILDLGCGTGQYAKLIENHSKAKYTGIDFSPVAIDIARNVARGEFYCETVIGCKWITGDCDIIIMLEFLEHLEHDIDFLQTIPAGKKIIASVPNYLSRGHFRAFATRAEVVDYYSDIILFENIHYFKISKKNKIFLFYGNKK